MTVIWLILTLLPSIIVTIVIANPSSKNIDDTPSNLSNIFEIESESDSSSVYVSEFEECLNLKNAIPADISLIFNVTKVNNHINILVYDDGKYDYYEYNVEGDACYTAIRKDTNPTRTFEEQMECDERKLKAPFKEYIEKYVRQFRCGYEVIKNRTDLVIWVHSTDGTYEYIVDRSTGRTELFLYNVFADDHFQFDNCLKKKYASEFDIPLEVTSKVIMENEYKQSRYLEILIKYQGRYDLYVTEKSGYVRHTELQLPDRPSRTLLDYADKLQCQQHIDFRVYHAHYFQCPLKVVEDANHVNISVNAFHQENVYVIDKSNNAMKYVKVKDNFVLSNLPIPDADLNHRAGMDKCTDKILKSTSPTFPIDVVKMKNFIQVWVKYNGTFNVYETTASGTEMCKIEHGFVGERPSIPAVKSIEDVHPECVSCDEPASSFYCPSFELDEDENEVKLEIKHGPGIWTHSYTFSKSSGKMTYFVGAVGPVASIPALVKSLVG